MFVVLFSSSFYHHSFLMHIYEQFGIPNKSFDFWQFSGAYIDYLSLRLTKVSKKVHSRCVLSMFFLTKKCPTHSFIVAFL